MVLENTLSRDYNILHKIQNYLYLSIIIIYIYMIKLYTKYKVIFNVHFTILLKYIKLQIIIIEK